MLSRIKEALGFTTTIMDNTIQSDIDACLLDLKRVGIITEGKMEDALVYKLVELYCKWQLNYQLRGNDYQKHYENMRDAISMCGDYNVEQ